MRKAIIWLAMLILLVTGVHAEVLDTGGQPIAVIIALPVVFGCMLLASAALMDKEEHGILRLFFMLFALTSFLLSHWMALQTVIKYYDFEPLQDSLATFIWVFGLFLFLVYSYVFIYMIYKSIEQARAKKNQKLGL